MLDQATWVFLRQTFEGATLATCRGEKASDPANSRRGGQATCAPGDDGFTLVELLVVVVIMPLIVGAISVALLATFRVQAGISDRLGASGDTQIVSANYFRDIQNATQIFAPTSSATTAKPQCGTTSPILSMMWPEGTSSASPLTVVSYSVAPNGFLRPGVQQYELVRSYCYNVPLGTKTATTATSTAVLAGNVPVLLASTINCVSGDSRCLSSASQAQSGWTSTDGIKSVTITVLQWASNPTNSNYNFSFTLAATPRFSTAGGGNTQVYNNDVQPLELLSTSSELSTCKSGSSLNINGPVDLSTGTSGKPTISAGSVYWYGSPPSQNQFLPDTSSPYSSTNPYYPPFIPLSSPFVDTLQNLPVPSSSALPTNPAPVSGVYQPGVYTTTLSGVSMAPGVYYFTGSGAGIDVATHTTLSGSGVMLYFTNSASLSLEANSAIALSPATSGSYTDVTIWQDKNDTVPMSVSGNSNTSGLTGVVYLPGSTLALNGTGTFYASDLVAQDVVCLGGGTGSFELGYNYVPQTLPTLTFVTAPPKNATVGSSAPVSATSTNLGGNPITYSVDGQSTATCSVSGNTVKYSSAGQCIIDVNQLGSAYSVAGTMTYYFAAYELQSTTKVS